MIRFLAALLLISGSAVAADLEELRKAAVVVCEPKGNGTGVVYNVDDKSYVLTAAHNIHDREHIWIKVRGAEDINPCTVLFVDKEADIAVLYPMNKVKVATTFGDGPVGEDIWFIGTMGNPANAYTVAGGNVANLDVDIDLGIRDATTSATVSGCSGGGIYAKDDGACFGIVTNTAVDGSLGFYVPTRAIRELLKKNNVPFPEGG